MKNGSKARKCGECGRIVCWLIPGKVWGDGEIKEVYPYKCPSNYPGYICVDCAKAVLGK